LSRSWRFENKKPWRSVGSGASNDRARLYSFLGDARSGPRFPLVQGINDFKIACL
jgi:hypothetical protein